MVLIATALPTGASVSVTSIMPSYSREPVTVALMPPPVALPVHVTLLGAADVILTDCGDKWNTPDPESKSTSIGCARSGCPLEVICCGNPKPPERSYVLPH